MKKSKPFENPKSKLKAWFLHGSAYCKKTAGILYQNARPFLALKYWPLYGLAFCLGLYLWGPGHGFQKLKTWQKNTFPQTNQVQSRETLELQLKRLKRQLQTSQNLQKGPVFDPVVFSRPASGQIVQGFDWFESGNSWRLHTGVDIGMPPGSNIIAAAAGTIEKTRMSEDGTYSVTVNHGDGWTSIYSNLATIMVKEGQAVIKGVIIGTSDAKGCDPAIPSFHFGIYHDGQALDPQKLVPGLTD